MQKSQLTLIPLPDLLARRSHRAPATSGAFFRFSFFSARSHYFELLTELSHATQKESFRYCSVFSTLGWL
jgi:hypothetical protein